MICLRATPAVNLWKEFLVRGREPKYEQTSNRLRARGLICFQATETIDLFLYGRIYSEADDGKLSAPRSTSPFLSYNF